MKRRFLAFLVCMAVLLASFTGCYSAQDGPSTLSSSQTMQSNSGSAAENSVEIRTYGIPEENVRANIIYVPSPSTGGFWTCAVFNAKTIQAYDPTTKTAYFPCYQAGCKHTDASCTANFGGVISGFAEYRGNFYAMIYYNDETASAFVTRRSPAVRSRSSQAGNRKMRMRNAGAASMAFRSERLTSRCQKKPMR